MNKSKKDDSSDSVEEERLPPTNNIKKNGVVATTATSTKPSEVTKIDDTLRKGKKKVQAMDSFLY